MSPIGPARSGGYVVVVASAVQAQRAGTLRLSRIPCALR